MKSFWKLYFHAIPLGLGIVLSLISVAYTIKVIGNSRSEDDIITAIFFGIIGFPMVIASVISLSKKPGEN